MMHYGPNPHVPGSDAFFMHEALELAHAGLGWTAPNPPVGCLLVRDGVVIGQGFHARDGANHAEHEALLAAGDARGAVAYTTLEPCSVNSRTPSCCHLLADYGVAEVVYGAADSDPRSSGRSVGVLDGLGIAARPPQGEGAAQAVRVCERFLDYYTFAHQQQQPFIHLKLALSMDAKLACSNGSSQWLSGPESLGFAHYLRQKYDALLVGHRTALIDDPRMTVRPEVLAGYRPVAALPRNPVRVVLDPRWEILPRLGDGPAGPALALADLSGDWRDRLPRLVVVGRRDLPQPASPALPGLELLALDPLPDGQLPFSALRQGIWDLGVRSLLVEGGAGVAQSLLAQCQADKLSAVYTPRLLGSDALGYSPELGLARVQDGMQLQQVKAAVLGDDVLLSGYPAWPG
jgi:diaminohydroxyphosphoribosylaminopyrimidine deaminase/5-amino-6-(5-phosphoribosylamino)uracil reductase